MTLYTSGGPSLLETLIDSNLENPAFHDQDLFKEAR